MYYHKRGKNDFENKFQGFQDNFNKVCNIIADFPFDRKVKLI